MTGQQIAGLAILAIVALAFRWSTSADRRAARRRRDGIDISPALERHRAREERS